MKGIKGFDWDTGNSQKNWQKHQVAQIECEEVFFNLPLLLKDDLKHSDREARYFVLGQTNEGRRLFLVFTLREEKIRVISARDMNKQEREAYEKANS